MQPRRTDQDQDTNADVEDRDSRTLAPRAPKDVALSPATTPIPTNTDVTKLPITYALSSLTGRGRLRMTNTTAITFGLVIAAETASGIR